MHVKKKTTTNSGKSLVGLSNLFFTWNFVNCLHCKQTFLQINLLVACRYKACPNSATMDWCTKIEKRPASHIMSSFFYMIALFISPHNKHKGKGMWFDSDSSHLWAGALCDDPIKKQLCSRLMFGWHTYFKQEKQAFPFSPTLKSVMQLLKLPVGNNKQAHNQGSQWFCGWVRERVYIGLFSKQ